MSREFSVAKLTRMLSRAFLYLPFIVAMPLCACSNIIALSACYSDFEKNRMDSSQQMHGKNSTDDETKNNTDSAQDTNHNPS